MKLLQNITSPQTSPVREGANTVYKVSPVRGRFRGGTRRRFRAGFLFALCAILSTLFFSCTDDLSVDGGINRTDGETFLTIYLPDVEAAASYGASRAGELQNTDALADASEAHIHTLWFFAFPVTKDNDKYVEDTSRKSIRVALSDMDPTGPVSGVFHYSQYDVGGFQQGGYRIYLLANIDRYTSYTTPESMSEQQVRELVLTFGNKLEKYLISGYLPMACLNTEIKDSESATQPVSNGVFQLSKDKNKVYADLTFLCAKVRYTILYDQTSFSNLFAEDADPDFLEGAHATANNVFQQYALTSEGKASSDVYNDFTIFNRSNERTDYPNKDDELESLYLNESGLTSKDGVPAPNLEKRVSNSWDEAKQRAWQGIIYLPVNLNTDENRSYIKFRTNKSYIEEYYTLNLPSSTGILEKGNFYDLLVRLVDPTEIELEPTVTINPWTTQSMAYALHGPFELKVEDTLIGVSSADWTILGYESDTDVSFISPKFPGPSESDPDLFTIEKIDANTVDDNGDKYVFEDGWESHLRIKVNIDVSYKGLENAQLDNYNYFHIKAGNLYKKILLDPITITPVLDVYPETITINVGEYKASGKNTDKFTITFNSNITVDKGEIRLTDNGGLKVGLGNGALNISSTNTDFDGISSPYTLKPKDGSNLNKGTIDVNVSGLISGNAFWDKGGTYYLTFSLIMDDSTIDTKRVKIVIVPYVSNYIIHFRCTDTTNKWTKPHIYVYQCLELPYGLDEKHKDWEGMTVGFPTSDGKGYLAALEYMFSNNVAFKGWYGYGGPEINDPNYGTHVFGGGFVLVGGKDNSYYYEPKLSNSNRYTFGINLNEDHLKDWDDWKCTECKKVKSEDPTVLYKDNRGWPGIAMADEGNGWFKYTLSGVATPGKTLIMFQNCHSGDDIKDNEAGNRFPKGEAVGVPLFDYPDHEGWFEFNGDTEDRNGNYFVDDEPKIEPEAKFKVYFDTKDSGWSGTPYIHYWGGESSSKWPGVAMKYEQGTIWSFELPDGTTGINFNDNGKGDKAKTKDFTAVNGHVYTKTGDQGLYGSEPEIEKDFYIYWPSSKVWTRLYVYDWENGTTKEEKNSWPSVDAPIEGNYRYLKFKSSSNSGNFTYIFCKQGEQCNTNNQPGHTILKNFQEIGGAYYAYFESHNHDNSSSLNLKSGKPDTSAKIYVDLYVRGSMSNNFGCQDEFRFYEVTEDSIWRTNNITIPFDAEFKIGSINWTPNLSPSTSSMYWINSTEDWTLYNNSNGQHMIMKINNGFYGYIELIKNENDYTMKLITQ